MTVKTVEIKGAKVAFFDENTNKEKVVLFLHDNSLTKSSFKSQFDIVASY